MPISFKVLPEVKAIHVKCTGVVSMEEILDHEVAVVIDPRFDATFTEIIDLSSAERLDLSHQDMGNIVDYENSHQRYVGNRKVAFVGPADVEFGLGRMYQMMEDGSPMETRVFRDLGAACEWAGLAVSNLHGG